MIDFSGLFPDSPRRGGAWKLVAFAVGLLLVGAYLLWCWYAPAAPMTTADYVPSRTAHELAKVPTEPLRLNVPLQVVPKSIANKKLKLPREVADDAGKQVIATAEIPATKGGATTVTLINTRTGLAETLVKEKPRALVSFERGTEIGVRYGVTTDGGQQAAVYARRDLLRLGGVYLSGYGEANINGVGGSEAKAMLDVSLRW